MTHPLQPKVISLNCSDRPKNERRGPGRPFSLQIAGIADAAEGNVSTVFTACALWSQWHLDFPPTGTTGDIALDRRLADAFRAIIAPSDLNARLTWLQGEVFLADHFPNPNAPADHYRATLIRWWLDLHGEAI